MAPAAQGLPAALDRDGAPDLLASARRSFPKLRHVFADGTYAGSKPQTARTPTGPWTLQIVKRMGPAKGFQLLPRRWVVERALAWLNRNRTPISFRLYQMANSTGSFLGVCSPHGPAQVVWTVRTVTKGSFNQKFERSPVYPSPWNDRYPDAWSHKIVNDAIGHMRIPTLVLCPFIDARPRRNVRIQYPLFFIPVRRSELIVGDFRKVDDYHPRSSVHRTVVHARVNFPIDVFSSPRISPDQHNGHRRIPEILVSDLTTDLLIGPLVRDVARVDGSIHEQGIPFPIFDQLLLVPLVITVVISDEHFMHLHFHCRGSCEDRGTRG